MNKKVTTLRYYKGSKKRSCSDKLLDFIRVNTLTMTDNELSEAINTQFNLNTTRMSVKSLRSFYGIKKGRENMKSKYLAESPNKNGKYGYIRIKTDDGKWVNKQKFLYEQAHGKIPKNHRVIFLDGNENNFNLDNLAAVTREEAGALSGLKLRFSYSDLTRTGIAIVRHSNILKARTMRK